MYNIEEWEAFRAQNRELAGKIEQLSLEIVLSRDQQEAKDQSVDCLVRLLRDERLEKLRPKSLDKESAIVWAELVAHRLARPSV